jgi:hypothetical protein
VKNALKKLFQDTEDKKKNETAKLNSVPCMQILETYEYKKCVTVKEDYSAEK